MKKEIQIGCAFRGWKNPYIPACTEPFVPRTKNHKYHSTCGALLNKLRTEQRLKKKNKQLKKQQKKSLFSEEGLNLIFNWRKKNRK